MSLVWGWALPATEKLVALKLADCAGDDGRNAWPAVATIATDCGLTRRGTQEVLKRLVVKGCIEVQAGHTNRKSTTYRVLVNAKIQKTTDVSGGEAASPLEVNDVRPSEVNVVPVEANGTTPGGEPRSPLEVNDVRPIHPTTVLDPSRTTRARDGRRSHPLDEPPAAVVVSKESLAQFDALWALYPNKQNRYQALRAWQTLAPTLELGGFIVEHVRVRLKSGWAQQPARFVPFLGNFLEDRRWNDRDVQTSAPASGKPEGLLVMRSCPHCGNTQEGVVRGGVDVYPPCQHGAPAGEVDTLARATGKLQ